MRALRGRAERNTIAAAALNKYSRTSPFFCPAAPAGETPAFFRIFRALACPHCHCSSAIEYGLNIDQASPRRLMTQL